MRKVHYLDYLFLDAFSTTESRKLKSLYHIFTGKRTVSVMIQSLKYELGGYFGLFPKLKWESFEKIIHSMVQDDFIYLVDEGYCVTEKGVKQKEDFFQTHTRINYFQQIRYVRMIPEFKKKSLFLVQVLSEMSHQNKDYFPLLEGLAEQNWLKSFIKNMTIPREEISTAYGKEWIALLENIKMKDKTIFVEQFEGNRYVRKTSRQVAEEYSLEESEVIIIWQQGWVQILVNLESHPNQYSILYKLYHQLKSEGYLWSNSVQETFLLLSSGVKPADLSSRRRLKDSTINDHLTELAILSFSFPFEQFLNEQQMNYVTDFLEKGDTLDYKEIQKEFPTISFFESRLMQVRSEVMKKDGKGLPGI
ncbi:helix-turn-helix domain-containing protein [Jeotgalibaca sp. MA1X17-3]|uniref:helix-turn-helix domain-containing protein n=1 Tax=Jeotgalibaca sp. MA1X17-3 TaxID=2908211 RepID=UPI001F260A55|nr:helix-turn-helix domain-containing protein [Jeotgalibaca sp. MA1X17-3]UJF14844.1 helix-turn-helix domain-containing protein [Jeotgalibaca sp. MA1X17-3]